MNPMDRDLDWEEELEEGEDWQGQAEAEDEIELTVETGFEGQRIDKYVNESMDTVVSRTQVQEWIRGGFVTVNGKEVKPNFKLEENDRILVRVPKPQEASIAPEELDLNIVYEDADVIVINKPRGMVVHPAAGHYSGTLVNGLLHHCKDLSGINGTLRPGIVHRIDKDTSGLIMAAKNDNAHRSLAAQLKEHSVTRKYIAIVHGNVPHDQGTVDAPIGRHPSDRKLFTVTDKNSKHAVTHFMVIERFGDFTMLELKLETGRTHQIRVHMKYIGYPLVGDPSYGKSKDKEMEGQALHAAVLGFIHPVTKQYLEFQAPLPQDMQDLLARIKLA